MTNNCPECRYYRIVDNKMVCWHEENVCDHAFVIPKEKAETHCCSEFLNHEKRCMDCEAFDSIREWCMNINFAEIRDSIVYPDKTQETNFACEKFVPIKGDDDD